MFKFQLVFKWEGIVTFYTNVPWCSSHCICMYKMTESSVNALLTYAVILPLLRIFVNICLKSIHLPRAIYVCTENWNYPNSILDQKFKSFGLNDSRDLNFLVFTQRQSISLKAAYVYSNKHNTHAACTRTQLQVDGKWKNSNSTIKTKLNVIHSYNGKDTGKLIYRAEFPLHFCCFSATGKRL